MGGAAKTVLVLSAGRTGTAFLARYFDGNYAGVTARHEPPPSRMICVASHLRLAGLPVDRPLAALLRRAARSRAADGLYIESNPYLSGCADLVTEAYGGPTVVHIVRDPREHVRSALGHGLSRGVKGLVNRLVPLSYPAVRRLVDPGENAGWPERAACTWTLYNLLIRRALAGRAGYHLFRFEELFDQSFSGLRRLCALFGLPFADEGAAVPPRVRVNRGTLDLLAPWREWPAEQCRRLHRICSPLMEEFGYGTEPAWRERVKVDG